MSGVQKTRRQRNFRFEQEDGFRVAEVYGVNTFAPHSKLPLEQCRSMINRTLWRGFHETRNGSSAITDTVNPFPDENIISRLPEAWDVGASEYFLFQTDDGAGGSNFYYAKIDGSSTAVAVKERSTSPVVDFAIADDSPGKLFLHKGSVYVFHSVGNYVIEYDSSGPEFYARHLGLGSPNLDSLGTQAGALTGRYAFGIELGYFASGDPSYSVSEATVASTPNRKDGSDEVLTIDLSAQNALVTVDSTSLPSTSATPQGPDDYWTHIRLFRSKRLDTDESDPSTPLPPQGTTAELYPEKWITRADFINGTGADMSAAYVIISDTPDDQINDRVVWSIDRIELTPLPASKVGAYHKGLVWSAEVQKGLLYYSMFAGTQYAEMHDPQAFLEASPGDGQQIIDLVPFERNLVLLKEGKTGVIADGDPSFGVEILDNRVGLPASNLGAFVTGYGLVSVVSDLGECRIFDYSQRWQAEINGVEVSRMIQAETAALVSAAYADMAYANGKLWLSDGVGGIWVLHVKEGLGWTKHEYPMNGKAQALVTYDVGRKIAVLSGNSAAVRLDNPDATTDFDTLSGSNDPITSSWTTAQFQDGGGTSLLETCEVGVIAQASSPVSCVPYVNGNPWPAGVAVTTPLWPDPSNYTTTALAKRPYWFNPQTYLAGNYIHFRFSVLGACTVDSLFVKCIIERNQPTPNFDPFGDLDFALVGPDWLTDLILYLKLNTDTVAQVDFSGNRYNHTWDDGTGGSRSFDGNLSPGGGQVFNGGTDSGLGDSGWEGLDMFSTTTGLLTENVGLEWVATAPSLSSKVVLSEAGDGTNYWRAQINTDGSLEFQIYTEDDSSNVVLSYKFTTTTGLISAGTQYTIQFGLSNSGYNGVWYYGPKSGAMSSPTTFRGSLL